MKRFVIQAICVCLPLASCGTKDKPVVTPNYTYQTECMGSELDGSVTVKAYGNGRNYFDASEQAMKNAVNDVLFKGISAGTGGCESRALVPEANARLKYEDFFNAFFRDGGEYRRYVSLRDERLTDKLSRGKIKTPQGETRAIVVRVLRGELKTRLKGEGILE